MTPDQILEIDAKRNYPKGTSVGDVYREVPAGNVFKVRF
jgi:hypothetical protein